MSRGQAIIGEYRSRNKPVILLTSILLIKRIIYGKTRMETVG